MHQKHRKIHLRKTNGLSKKMNYKWAIIIVIWTFLLSILMSTSTSLLMERVRLGAAFFILVGIIVIGVVFDTIGVAVTAAQEAPFHSMSARKGYGAKESLWLIRNAEKVSNFCNDVIGDIASVVSGAASAMIAAEISVKIPSNLVYLRPFMIGLLVTASVAAATVGSKAIGKMIGISKANNIVFRTGMLIAGLKIFIHKSKRRKNR